jgi:hypothetical protein
MREHRCDNIGVMDLTAAEGEATAQLDQLVPDLRTVFKNLEIAGYNHCRACGLGGRFRLSPDLGSRYDGDELTQYLAADAELFAGGGMPRKCRPRLFAIGRPRGRSVDQHVGVDEHHRPSSP